VCSCAACRSRVRGRQCRAGFHRVDLLACVSLILLCSVLGMTAFSHGEREARFEKCCNSLRQLHQVSVAYGLSHAGETPPAFPPGTTGGSWPWDMSTATTDALLSLGARPEYFYCPTTPTYYDADLYWGHFSSFRILGYVFATRGSARVLSSEIVTNFAMTNPESRPYIADAILSSRANSFDREGNVYTGIFGAFPSSSHDSAHMRGQLPEGGNLMMLDGHIEWRVFERMKIRTTGSPSFWW